MNECIFRQAWIEITIINREEIYFSTAITEFSGDYHKSVLLSDSFRLEVMILTQSFIFSVTNSPQTVSTAHFLLLLFNLPTIHLFSFTFFVIPLPTSSYCTCRVPFKCMYYISACLCGLYHRSTCLEYAPKYYLEDPATYFYTAVVFFFLSSVIVFCQSYDEKISKRQKVILSRTNFLQGETKISVKVLLLFVSHAHFSKLHINCSQLDVYYAGWSGIGPYRPN